MADGTKLSVAIERAIHDALRASIQRIADQHRIKIVDLQVKWSSSNEFGVQTSHRIEELEVHTVSVHP